MPSTRDRFMEAVDSIGNLCPAPRTLGRALSLLRDPDSDIGDIAVLVSQDPALAADILRCANSASYGAGARVASIEEAVQKIGSSETIRLLGRVITHTLTRMDLPNYGIDTEDFWAESLFNGIFVEQLALATGDIDADEAYLAGLLRFIGRLAINEAMRSFGAGVFWDGRGSLAAWERENSGVTYCEAGGALLRRWQLPEAVVTAVEGQDALASAESPVPLVQSLHFTSSLLPPGLQLDFFLAVGERPIVIPRQDGFVRSYGLTQDLVSELLERTQEKFAAVREERYH